MKKLILLLTLCISMIGLTYGVSSQRNYNHDNVALNDEFDNIYSKFDFSELRIPEGQKIFLNDGIDTYITSPSDGVVNIVVDDIIAIAFSAIDTHVFGNFIVDTGSKIFLGDATYIYEAVADRLDFVVGSATVMQITEQVGSDTVDINEGNLRIDATYNLYFDGSDGMSYIKETSDATIDIFTGGVTVFTATNSGTRHPNGVRIGTNAADKEIDDAAQGGASTALFIGDSQITVSSDKRLKTNIVDTQIDGLNMIDRFNVVDFDWNVHVSTQDTRKKRGSSYTGLLAQDVIHIAPWAVHSQGGKDCRKCLNGIECEEHPISWQLQYEYIVPILIKAVQELKAQVVELRQ